jgi:hypothetical protein
VRGHFKSAIRSEYEVVSQLNLDTYTNLLHVCRKLVLHTSCVIYFLMVWYGFKVLNSSPDTGDFALCLQSLDLQNFVGDMRNCLLLSSEWAGDISNTIHCIVMNKCTLMWQFIKLFCICCSYMFQR